MTLVPPIKWHGGKHYLAPKIIALMPPRCRTPNKPDPADPGWLHYVEPYAGGLAVLLANDPKGASEVANDLNGPLTNFWSVLVSGELFDAFRGRVEAVPFSEEHWREAKRMAARVGPYDVTAAVAFFTRCRQSLAGRMDAFAPLTRNRTRRGMNEQASAWLTAVEGLPAVHERLKRVVILNHDARDVIRQQDGPRTLHYVDPTYLKETRASPEVYAHEMTEQQHTDLLDTLTVIKGRFLLSGYRSTLYDHYADSRGWHRHDFDLPNNAAGGAGKRRMTESVWCNYEAPL